MEEIKIQWKNLLAKFSSQKEISYDRPGSEPARDWLILLGAFCVGAICVVCFALYLHFFFEQASQAPVVTTAAPTAHIDIEDLNFITAYFNHNKVQSTAPSDPSK